MCTESSLHPCRQCLSCRINDSRVWASRLMLEAQSHSVSLFVTLTYEVEPDGRNLRKESLSSAMHRLRSLAARAFRGTVRFYACGEYGDQTGRPHYHAAIFGLRPEDVLLDPSLGKYRCPLIEQAWRGPHAGAGAGVGGNVDVGFLSPESAAYITGYVTKKLANSKTLSRLDGRTPEFHVMSRRPGLGSSALPSLIEALNTSHGALYLSRHGDVPSAFQVGSRLLPLGTHLRGLLRSFFFGDHRQPQTGKDKANERFSQNVQAHLPPLPLNAQDAEKVQLWIEAMAESHEAYVASKRQKARKVAKRHEISNSRKTL